MKKRLRTILSLILAVFILTNVTAPVFAKSTTKDYTTGKIQGADNIVITENNKERTVVKEFKENETIVATYDTISDIVITNTYDKEEQYLIKSVKLDLKQIKREPIPRKYQNTISNREYNVKDGYWRIRSKSQKNQDMKIAVILDI